MSAAPDAPAGPAAPSGSPAQPSTAAAAPAAGHGQDAAAPAYRQIASDALFAGAHEVHISHRGALYRLKRTALGKLILTK